MALWDETGTLKGKTKTTDKARVRAMESQWKIIDLAIYAFKLEYPVDWKIFEVDMRNRKKNKDYYTAETGELKKSGYRHTASFPVINRVDSLSGQVVEIDSLYPVLNKIIPGLTHKTSVNFIPFLKRHPIFNPGAKIAASE